MRRRIQLYLGGQAADLPDDALVLFNWATTDASNPTIVKNSFSQSFNLPRTARNEAIFGHSGRLDRTAGSGGTGAAFNASRKLPFTIYNETSEVLASGYAKLDSVTDDALAVSLYGGLGELMYNLSYDSAGNKRTLASLDFGGGDAELDFDITASAVSDAWARLGGDTSKPEMWDIINFAPCYNGVPDGDFDAGKALAKPEEIGLNIPAGQQASGGGHTIIELATPLDEWEARDLRSYLQRPVVSVWKLLRAMADSNNNGGWNVDLTDINNATKWPYIDTWLTRPLLPSMGTFKQDASGASVTIDPLGYVQTNPFGRFDVTDAPANQEITYRLSFRLWFNVPGASSLQLVPYFAFSGGARQQVLFVQAIGYAADNTKVAASPVKAFYYSYNKISPSALASVCGFIPDPLNTGFSSPEMEHGYALDTAPYYKRQRNIDIEMPGTNVARIDIVVRPYYGAILDNGLAYDFQQGAYLLNSSNTEYYPTYASIPTGTGTATAIGAASLRSGSHITKQMLLSTSETPAAYLLAFCKVFGLLMLTDTAAKKVTILRRKSFYVDETIDLTDRVDKSKGIEITPLSFDSKWYDFKLESVGGAFEKEYDNTEGVQYGIQRVDTNYDFDAETKDVLNGVALKSCASVLKFARFMIEAPVAQDIFGASDLSVAPGSSVTSMANIWYNDFGADGHGYVERVKVRTIVGTIYLYKVVVSGGSATATLLTQYTSAGGGEVVDLSIGITLGPNEFIGVNGSFPFEYPVTGVVCGYFPSGGGSVQTNQVQLWIQVYMMSQVTPPAFILPGNKYTLWDSNGDSQENDVPQYTGAVTPLQSIGPYDFYEKAQFHDADGKPVEGADCLLLFNGIGDALRSYPLTITDDLPEMDTLNGKPCWLFSNDTTPLLLPYFSRYNIVSGVVTDSLDFGPPREVDIPGLDYPDGVTIYDRGWSAYIADRLSVHSKVLKCRVLFDGLQVGPELLRKFWWYRGSLWVLNKISNYSLTTFDAAECEFIQVRDKDKYIDNQY